MPDLFFLTNTFSSLPLEGGSAGVCILEHERELDWMLGVSRALNLTDAVFLVPRSPNRFNMRYLAGFMEVEFGVSGTLAAAHILYTEHYADSKRSISFFTHGGSIAASTDGKRIEVIFPQLPFTEIEPPEQILQAVDPRTEFVGKRGQDYLVQVSSESRLRKLQPEFRLLDPMGIHGLIITAPAASGHDYDFVFRTFQLWPRHWSDTPVASWANLSLAPFWLGRLGKTRMRGFRNGPKGTVVSMEVDGDRLKISGEAITILKGELKI